MAPAIGRQRRELVVVEAARIVQQASDQRALAIIDAAAGDESQQVAGLVLAQVGGEVDLGVHGLGAPVVSPAPRIRRLRSTPPVSSSPSTPTPPVRSPSPPVPALQTIV